LIDCQLPNPHLRTLGSRALPRAEFLARLAAAGVGPATP
jgi:Leu/Phe-tRNA-protein transferase